MRFIAGLALGFIAGAIAMGLSHDEQVRKTDRCTSLDAWNAAKD